MPSVQFRSIPRTTDNNQVINEFIMSFTHDIEIHSKIPGMFPVRKYVELSIVLMKKFKGNKMAHEYIYWIKLPCYLR